MLQFKVDVKLPTNPASGVVLGAAYRLVCKHFLQHVNDFTDGVWCQTTEAFDESLAIDRPKLIQRHEAGLLLKPAWNPPGVRLSASGHGCHDRRAEVLIEFVR